MPEEQTNPLYPKKPHHASDFKKAVAWFGGRELIASLKGVIVYAIYGENIDPRSWMKANKYPNVEDKIIQLEIEKEVIKQEIENEAVKKEINDEEIEKEIETAEVKIKSQTEPEKLSLPGEETELYSVRKTEATAKIKDDIKNEDTKLKKKISREAKQEWAKKISDHWKWKQIHYAKWEEFSTDPDFWNKLQPGDQTVKEFWFDYIADSGDGQMGVYNVACLCMSDLWIKNSEEKKADSKSKNDKASEPEVKFEPPEKAELEDHHLLPRGAFLFVGGDTAYHASNYDTLYERFQLPFRWAFTSVRQFMAEKYGIKETSSATVEIAQAEILENTSKELEGSIPAYIFDKLYSDTEPPRPIFGIPANHDYYDGIDGFNRLFRRPPFDDIEENMTYKGSRGKLLLQIPTFTREQEASYIAISLPFDWWMFGIDSENEKLDFRQELFFKQIIEKKPAKLILATPEPTTVFGKKSGDEEKTAVYLRTITSELGLSQPFLTDGKLKQEQPAEGEISKTAPVSQTTGDEAETPPKADLSKKYCRLDLSGDVHHYARYWGENTRDFKTDKFSSDNYASIVAGGGGAFFDVTRTLIGKPEDESGNPLNGDRKVRGEIPPQQIFPSEKDSVDKTADRIFDLWNLRKGGYVQIAGAVIAIIIFYFLNFYSNISQIAWRADVFTSEINKIDNLRYTGAVLFLLAVVGIISWTAYGLNKLITELKEKSLKGKLDEKIDGRVKQLGYLIVGLIFAVAVYAVFLLFAYNQDIVFKTKTTPFDGYLLSLILFLHLVISLLILWLSAEYTNWLTIRFKIARKFKRKTFAQKLEDPHRKTSSRIVRFIGKILRLYTYQYFPANLLVVLAIAVLVMGINLFGRVQFAVTLADLLLTLTILGILVLVVIFAYSVGATYHRAGINKYYFIGLGLWHALLQLVTPYLMFVHGSGKVILGIFLLVIIFNGSAILSYIIRKLFARNNKNSVWNKIANIRLAALLTKWIDSRWLLLVWLVLGLLVLYLPVRYPETKGFYETIRAFVENDLSRTGFYQNLHSLFNQYFMTNPKSFDQHITVLISVVIVGYIGYVMSRVWLSWYLAVTMFFDGHNNEIGGAARIEGFKHILRIKVEEEKLTVYVIGFDEAEPEMRDLKLKLVDKFELNCKTIS